MTLTNERLKVIDPEGYKAGYRVAEDFGYLLPEKVKRKIADPKTGCTRCGKKQFKLRGIGVTKVPYWVCSSCGTLKKALYK